MCPMWDQGFRCKHFTPWMSVFLRAPDMVWARLTRRVGVVRVLFSRRDETVAACAGEC
jgi:hypothetical protein